MSLPEVLLWKALQTRPDGLKFRKQYPIGRMTADFACLSHRLITEVDGESHGCVDQLRHDELRDQFLKEEGFQVMRIAARDVLRNLDGVVLGIVTRCAELGPLHQPAAGPPPRSGEDL